MTKQIMHYVVTRSPAWPGDNNVLSGRGVGSEEAYDFGTYEVLMDDMPRRMTCKDLGRLTGPYIHMLTEEVDEQTN